MCVGKNPHFLMGKAYEIWKHHLSTKSPCFCLMWCNSISSHWTQLNSIKSWANQHISTTIQSLCFKSNNHRERFATFACRRKLSAASRRVRDDGHHAESSSTWDKRRAGNGIMNSGELMVSKHHHMCNYMNIIRCVSVWHIYIYIHNCIYIYTCVCICMLMCVWIVI